MDNVITKISSLIEELPIKDREIAKKFLSTRDFESLDLLVSSTITIVERNRVKVNDKYADISIPKLNLLSSEIKSYLLLLPKNNEDASIEDDYYEEDDYYNMEDE